MFAQRFGLQSIPVSPSVAAATASTAAAAATTTTTTATATATTNTVATTATTTVVVVRRGRVGDIGPKIGFNTMDNGFCSFDHVRVPRGNMVMRHQTVDRDGTYTKTGSKEGSKIAYITVMQVSATNHEPRAASDWVRGEAINLF